jgi:hypothetical protein
VRAHGTEPNRAAFQLPNFYAGIGTAKAAPLAVDAQRGGRKCQSGHDHRRSSLAPDHVAPFPCKIVVLNNGGIGPGMPEIPDNPMFNMKPNSLIYGARYDRMMEAFGGKGFFVEDPKDLKGALDEAMNHRGPALVNVVISQGAARKPQQSRWHS